jgi:predicted amidohydrolase
MSEVSQTRTMNVAVVQMSSQEDVAKNLARVEALVGEAAAAGAELVALPENFAFMGPEDEKRGIAETADGTGPILGVVCALAKTHRVHIVAGGMPERSEAPARPFNTSVLVNGAGDVVARYRKIHLFDVDLPDGTSLKESDATKGGSADGIVVHDVNGVKLGMSVCYDVRFPELYRALEKKGARMITVPAAFTLTTGKDHWHVLLRARAIENQVYVIAPGQHGKHPRGRQTYGKSVIIDPWGDVLAQAREGEGFAMARIDLAYQDKVRAAIPCLSHKKLGQT